MTTVEARPFARPARSGNHRNLDLVVEAVDNMRRILSPDALPPIEKITDFASATRALRIAGSMLDSALEGDSESAESAISATDLVDLTRRLRRAESAVGMMDVERRSNHLDLVRETLERFDGVQSVNQLTEECPRAISQLGFDRGMLSLVEKSIWTPLSAHSERQPEWADQLVASGREAPQHLVAALPEFSLIRRSPSILVTNVQQQPRVYKAVVEASQSRSYVAARVTANGILIGFMHADRFYSHENVNEADRSMLGLFAEAFGYILARAIVINHASTIQARLATLTAGINDAAASLGNFDLDLGVGDPDDVDFDEPTATLGSTGIAVANCGLTRREMQVLQLMANGASNVDIATRLYIAPNTVKSHAKHILRKLGAANRAEAVSRWFNSAAATTARDGAPGTAAR